MPLLRVAGPGDVDQLAAVFLDCWQVSYARVMPAALVEGMTARRARAVCAGALGRPGQTIVAPTGDEPPGAALGFVGFRLEEGGDGYVSSLYVSPRAQGGGLGRALLAAAGKGARGGG